MQCPTVTAAAAPRITVPPGTAPPLHTPPASVPLPVEQRRPPTPLRRDTAPPQMPNRKILTSLAREPTRHRGALAKGRWSDHPAGACQKAWPQQTLDRGCRPATREEAVRAPRGRDGESALLARGGQSGQASGAAERSRIWCLGRASQSDGWLAPPPAVRHGRVLCGRPWKRLERRPCLVAVQPGWSKDTSSKSNERLEIADSSSEQTIIPFAV